MKYFLNDCTFATSGFCPCNSAVYILLFCHFYYFDMSLLCGNVVLSHL